MAAPKSNFCSLTSGVESDAHSSDDDHPDGFEGLSAADWRSLPNFIKSSMSRSGWGAPLRPDVRRLCARLKAGDEMNGFLFFMLRQSANTSARIEVFKLSFLVHRRGAETQCLGNDSLKSDRLWTALTLCLYLLYGVCFDEHFWKSFCESFERLHELFKLLQRWLSSLRRMFRLTLRFDRIRVSMC